MGIRKQNVHLCHRGPHGFFLSEATTHLSFGCLCWIYGLCLHSLFFILLSSSLLAQSAPVWSSPPFPWWEVSWHSIFPCQDVLPCRKGRYLGVVLRVFPLVSNAAALKKRMVLVMSHEPMTFMSIYSYKNNSAKRAGAECSCETKVLQLGIVLHRRQPAFLEVNLVPYPYLKWFGFTMLGCRLSRPYCWWSWRLTLRWALEFVIE